MSTAYRTGPSTVRRALLQRRRTLLSRSTEELDPAMVAELDELAASLEGASRDPVDHVAKQLRAYELTLEAGLAAGRQRRDKRWRSMGAMAAMMALGVGLLGGRVFWQLSDYDFRAGACSHSAPCRGDCHVELEHDGFLGVAYACVATSAEDCAEGCAESGTCTAIDGVCRATKDEDCAASQGCIEEGRCEAFGGDCIVRSSDHCRQSEACRVHGLCSYSYDGDCEAGSDEHCMASEDCVLNGECVMNGGFCRPAGKVTAADCRRLLSCINSGFCPEDEARPAACAAMLREPASVSTLSTVVASRERPR